MGQEGGTWVYSESHAAPLSLHIQDHRLRPMKLLTDPCTFDPLLSHLHAAHTGFTCRFIQ